MILIPSLLSSALWSFNLVWNSWIWQWNYLPILQLSSKQAPTYSLTMTLNFGGFCRFEAAANWAALWPPGVVKMWCSSAAPMSFVPESVRTGVMGPEEELRLMAVVPVGGTLSVNADCRRGCWSLCVSTGTTGPRCSWKFDGTTFILIQSEETFTLSLVHLFCHQGFQSCQRSYEWLVKWDLSS